MKPTACHSKENLLLGCSRAGWSKDMWFPILWGTVLQTTLKPWWKTPFPVEFHSRKQTFSFVKCFPSTLNLTFTCLSLSFISHRTKQKILICISTSTAYCSAGRVPVLSGEVLLSAGPELCIRSETMSTTQVLQRRRETTCVNRCAHAQILCSVFFVVTLPFVEVVHWLWFPCILWRLPHLVWVKNWDHFAWVVHHFCSKTVVFERFWR